MNIQFKIQSGSGETIPIKSPVTEITLTYDKLTTIFKAVYNKETHKMEWSVEEKEL